MTLGKFSQNTSEKTAQVLCGSGREVADIFYDDTKEILNAFMIDNMVQLNVRQHKTAARPNLNANVIIGKH